MKALLERAQILPELRAKNCLLLVYIKKANGLFCRLLGVFLLLSRAVIVYNSLGLKLFSSLAKSM